MYDFWQQRYSEKDSAYGDEPNVFFKQYIDSREPGRLLLPAEGEGRNAVYAAEKGWQVDAYDFSQQAIANAKRFAAERGVSINYIHAGHDTVALNEQEYDTVALIYAHVANDARQAFHRKLLRYLKPGGEFVLEAFTKEQINNTSGGPRDVSMLYHMKDVRSDFEDNCDIPYMEEMEMLLDEGKYHVGHADIIRMIAKKR